MSAPDAVVALAQERAQAKADRDFARADQLREAIDQAGWRIVDTPSGFELIAKPPYDLVPTIDALQPIDASGAVTVGLILDGWWSDFEKCLQSIGAYSDVQVLVLDVSNDVETSMALTDYAKAHPFVTAFHVERDPGWGRSARRLAELASTPFHVFMDPSTTFTGDAIAEMLSAMRDDVVAVGWKGALVDLKDEWRSVVDAGPGEVDVLLGYLMMVRREALLATDYPHPKARFYRNADLELSLGLRAHGGRLLALDLPVEQGRHHGYHDSDPTMRARESKRTYDRILATFRGREEILAPRRP